MQSPGLAPATPELLTALDCAWDGASQWAIPRAITSQRLSRRSGNHWNGSGQCGTLERMAEKPADRILRAAAEGHEYFGPYVEWVRSEGVAEDDFGDYW